MLLPLSFKQFLELFKKKESSVTHQQVLNTTSTAVCITEEATHPKEYEGTPKTQYIKEQRMH